MTDLLAQFKERDDNREDKWKTTRPTKEELEAALRELQTETMKCGRCSWVCRNPHPGMPQFQMVRHAIRHREVESLPDGELKRAYVFARDFVIDEWTMKIGYAELERRGIPTRDLALPYLRETC